jgi:RNA-directed DNA polymerase
VLSPLLGNIMLDDLDKLLEQRGHRFCRYADDCNIYVRSQRAGDRTMSAVRRFIEGRLGLRLNEEKSKVDRPQNRKFLGFSFFGRIETKIRVAPKSLERFRDRVREITARSNGWSMERRIRALVNYVRGWMQYFRLARTPSVYRNLEGWILRRLRLCLWKQWKRPRTRLRKLRALGLPDWVCFASAMSRQGYWRMSGGPMNRAILVHFGTHKALLGQPTSIPKFDEPPDADRHVRWCGRTGMATSPPTRLGFAQAGRVYRAKPMSPILSSHVG